MDERLAKQLYEDNFLVRLQKAQDDISLLQKLYVAAADAQETHLVVNPILNGGFPLFQRSLTPTTAVAMTDGGYNGPDMWYSLIQGAGATIARDAGIGTSQYSAKLVSGGTTNRYGIAQIFSAEKSFPFRGKTINAQIRIKPTNNAGSGTRDYRIAVLEWTGTADAPVKDVVNDWTSSNYTTGNFFKSTTTVLVGTAKISADHGIESVLSVTGSVSVSCKNLIVFAWVEDVPTHASDYANFSEAIFCEGETTQSWMPVDDTDECLSYCEVWENQTGLNIVSGLADSTSTFTGVMRFEKLKFKTPTVTFSAAGDFTLRYTGSGTNTCTAIAAPTLTRRGATITATGTGTPLTAGQSVNIRCGNTTGYIVIDANLGV